MRWPSVKYQLPNRRWFAPADRDLIRGHLWAVLNKEKSSSPDAIIAARFLNCKQLL